MSDQKSVVLYVEDDDDNYRLMKRVLESTQRYRVARAEDGERGFEFALELSPALILVDLNLPVMNGLELAEALKQEKGVKHVPIVAVSANVMNNERQLAKEVGIHSFVEKPIDIIELRKLVDSLVKPSCKMVDNEDPNVNAFGLPENDE
jgi:CheY-like chemotaxis protein